MKGRLSLGLILGVFPIFLIVATPLHCVGQQSYGDLTIWLPAHQGVKSQDSQIIRDGEYLSVRLQSVYVFYKSGFLANIRTVVVKSQIDLKMRNSSIQGGMVDATRDKANSTGEFIGCNDLLAALTPSTPDAVQIEISFRGVGQDRFKSLFDLLATPDFKQAVSMSPAAIGVAGTVTSLLKRLLASPYTSDNPKDMLDVSQSFVLYPDTTKDHQDAFREGYLIILSGRAGATNSLNYLGTIAPSDFRLSPGGQVLEYKAPTGQWVQLTDDSYVVLSVTRSKVRGEDDPSPWYAKYTNAEEEADKILTGEALKDAQRNANIDYEQANALLDQDPNYIQSERDSIKALHYKKINEALATAAKQSGQVTVSSELLMLPKSLPLNYGDLVDSYLRSFGSLRVRVPAEIGSAFGVELVNTDSGVERTWGPIGTQIETHEFTNLPPGNYVVEIVFGGYTNSEAQLQIQPGATSEISCSQQESRKLRCSVRIHALER